MEHSDPVANLLENNEHLGKEVCWNLFNNFNNASATGGQHSCVHGEYITLPILL